MYLITRIKRFKFQSETWEHITRVLQEANYVLFNAMRKYGIRAALLVERKALVLRRCVSKFKDVLRAVQRCAHIRPEFA